MAEAFAAIRNIAVRIGDDAGQLQAHADAGAAQVQHLQQRVAELEGALAAAEAREQVLEGRVQALQAQVEDLSAHVDRVSQAVATASLTSEQVNPPYFPLFSKQYRIYGPGQAPRGFAKIGRKIPARY